MKLSWKDSTCLLTRPSPQATHHTAETIAPHHTAPSIKQITHHTEQASCQRAINMGHYRCVSSLVKHLLTYLPIAEGSRTTGWGGDTSREQRLNDTLSCLRTCEPTSSLQLDSTHSLYIHSQSLYCRCRIITMLAPLEWSRHLCGHYSVARISEHV